MTAPEEPAAGPGEVLAPSGAMRWLLEFLRYRNDSSVFDGCKDVPAAAASTIGQISSLRIYKFKYLVNCKAAHYLVLGILLYHPNRRTVPAPTKCMAHCDYHSHFHIFGRTLSFSIGAAVQKALAQMLHPQIRRLNAWIECKRIQVYSTALHSTCSAQCILLCDT